MRLVQNVLFAGSVILTIGIVCSSCKTTVPTVRNGIPQVEEIDQADKNEMQGIQAVEKIRYIATETRAFDLIHTNLEVSFDWPNRRVNGNAELTLKPYFFTQRACTLDAKGMEILSVWLSNISEPLPFINTTDQLIIDLKEDYSKKDTIVLQIKYLAKPYERKANGGSAITDAKGLYFVNHDGKEADKPQQIWTQGQPESNSAWFPTIDAPNERMTQEIAISVQNRFTTLSNGLLLYSTDNGDGTRTDYWKQSIPHPPYLVMLAVGEFAVAEDEWNAMEVNYYVEPEYQPFAKQIFGNTPEMLTFFSNLLGVPYPWEKYSQIAVRDYVSGAMENTTAVVHGEFLQRNANQLLDETNEDFISHELIHHWFGDYVTCESWGNVTLNEAFATYGEYLWNEYKYGVDEADYYGLLDLAAYLRESEGKQVDMIRYNYEDVLDLFDAHSYQKGGRILHYLRSIVGDEAFFASLQFYLQQHALQSVEIHDLRLALEHVTGQDLNWFFNQWFFSSGHPQLEVSYKYDSLTTTQIVIIEQKQNLSKTPQYKLPMDVVLSVNKNIEKHRIVLEDKKQEFTFKVKSKPQMVLVDVGRKVPGTLKDNKSADDLIYQYKNSPHYLGRIRALEGLKKYIDINEKEHVEFIFVTARDPYWHVRYTSIGLMEDLAEIAPLRVKKMLGYMAEEDPKSLVRAEAVYVLGKVFKEDKSLMGVYEKAVRDSSYMVFSEGLDKYAMHNPEEALKIARALKEHKISDVKAAVANVLVEHGNADDHDFFISGLQSSSTMVKLEMLGLYGDYLSNNDSYTLQKGIPFISEMAKSANTWWLRGSAMNTLTQLANLAAAKGNDQTIAEEERASYEASSVELQKTIEEIKQQETNTQLRRIYDKS